MAPRPPRRDGTTTVEVAIVLPVLFLFISAVVLLGYAVLLKHQVSHAAREASRWASVRGAQYAKDNKKSPTTAQEVYDGAIKKHAVGMQASKLTYAVAWSDPNQNPYVTLVVNNQVVTRATTVTVTVNYSWSAGPFGTLPLTATSTTPMAY